MIEPASRFGEIDIYLFDQLQRGRIAAGMVILDAGCGTGRNLEYFLGAGYDVFGADMDREAIAAVRALAARLAPQLPPTNFRAEPVEAMSFDDGAADLVISSAVLHFAGDEGHFRAMLERMWRLLRSGGLLFCRLASTIGLSELGRPARHLGGRRYRLPDGSERFLVDRDSLLEATDRLGGTLADPIKTTIVDQQRCMTTWVVRRP